METLVCQRFMWGIKESIKLKGKIKNDPYTGRSLRTCSGRDVASIGIRDHILNFCRKEQIETMLPRRLQE
jgi:hypothetical protein